MAHKGGCRVKDQNKERSKRWTGGPCWWSSAYLPFTMTRWVRIPFYVKLFECIWTYLKRCLRDFRKWEIVIRVKTFLVVRRCIFECFFIFLQQKTFSHKTRLLRWSLSFRETKKLLTDVSIDRSNDWWQINVRTWPPLHTIGTMGHLHS